MIVVLAVVGWRTVRWRVVWVPVAAAFGAGGTFEARWYVDSQGLASDPAPARLWVSVAVFVGAVAVAVLGWRGLRWWQRGLSVLAVPLSLVCVGVVLNQWVGYFPTVQAAWGAVTAGPLPDQVDVGALPALRNTAMSSGKVVSVDTGDGGSGFKHRTEYVYLPPAWFGGDSPPQLPVIMMIAGEFNTPADWMRTGDAVETVDSYAAAHGGSAPILVFVDAGGSFNNDTECVDGPRGNAADHLTNDVRPYMISTFDAASDAANWGVVGWSMGGTCAVDLTVMHPELFGSFEDIAGDLGPTAGTKEQTIDRLYGGDAAQWSRYDPTTVLAKHGRYAGVAGWFEDTAATAGRGGGGGAPYRASQPDTAADGYGGQDHASNPDNQGAAEDLCAAAAEQAVSCSVHTVRSGHTWQFAAGAFSDALPWMAERIGPTLPATSQAADSSSTTGHA